MNARELEEQAKMMSRLTARHSGVVADMAVELLEQLQILIPGLTVERATAMLRQFSALMKDETR